MTALYVIEYKALAWQSKVQLNITHVFAWALT